MTKKKPKQQWHIKNMAFRFWVVFVWLASFLWCLGVPLALHTFIPHQFGNVLREVFDTFAPTLTVMLSFIFARAELRDPRAQLGESRLIGVMALCVAGAYCAAFSFLTWQFFTERTTVVSLIKDYKTIRPVLGFLVSGMVAFYFGSAKARQP
jgi:hypothetical protein